MNYWIVNVDDSKYISDHNVLRITENKEKASKFVSKDLALECANSIIIFHPFAKIKLEKVWSNE